MNNPYTLRKDVEFQDRPGYLRIRVATPQNIDHAPALFHAIWSEANTSGKRGVLLDFRESTGRLSAAEAAQAGHLASWALRGLRVAFVIQPERNSGHLQPIATARGLACQGFSQEDEAVAWLQAA